MLRLGESGQVLLKERRLERTLVDLLSSGNELVQEIRNFTYEEMRASERKKINR